MFALTSSAAESDDPYPITVEDRRFLAEVLGAGERRDLAWIAARALLPMNLHTKEGLRLMRTEADFVSAVAPLFTDAVRAEMKIAAAQPLFRNWRGIMMGNGILWFEAFIRPDGSSHYLIMAFGGIAFQPADSQVEEHAAFKVHGRLSVFNGNPSCRIWIVGTKRILGVMESAPPETLFMPAKLGEMLTPQNLIFADFTVAPLTDDKPGVMRMVRVIAAENIVVTDENRNLLRRVRGRIEN